MAGSVGNTLSVGVRSKATTHPPPSDTAARNHCLPDHRFVGCLTSSEHEPPEDAYTSENSSPERVTIAGGNIGRPDDSPPELEHHHRISTREAVRKPLSSPHEIPSDALDDQ